MTLRRRRKAVSKPTTRCCTSRGHRLVLVFDSFLDLPSSLFRALLKQISSRGLDGMWREPNVVRCTPRGVLGSRIPCCSHGSEFGFGFGFDPVRSDRVASQTMSCHAMPHVVSDQADPVGLGIRRHKVNTPGKDDPVQRRRARKTSKFVTCSPQLFPHRSSLITHSSSLIIHLSCIINHHPPD